MNSNFFHNIANVLMVVMATFTAFLLATGCTQSATGTLECHASMLSGWFSPEVTTIAIAALGALKIVVNVLRDGLGGLTKPQPPVQK